MIKHLHTIVSTLLLWVIGLIVVSLIKGISLGKDLKSNSLYIVELSENILPGQKITAESLIKDLPGVKKSSLEFVPKNKGAEIMMTELPQLANYNEDIFRDLITFKANSLTTVEIAALRKSVVDISGVSGFYHEEDIFSGIDHGISRFRLTLIFLALILLMAVVLVIFYALRQAFSLKRSHIVAMYIAGSSRDMIIRPYLKLAIRRALQSAGIALILLVFNILLINSTLLRGIEISILQTVSTCLVVTLIAIATYYLTTSLTASAFLKNFKITSH